MATILLAAELGGGQGHVRRMLPLARDLAGQGHRSVFVIPNAAEVASIVEGEGHSVLTAPRLPGSADPARPRVAASYADILGSVGLGDPSGLPRVVRDWERILDQVRPTVIVCEGSPFLCVAALARPVPVVVQGYGFVLPPVHLEHFPVLVPGETPLFREEDLLANVDRVLRARGCPTPASLPALLTGTRRFMTGLPELDPYRTERRDLVVGPPPTGVRRMMSAGSEDVFAYLAGNGSVTPALLRALVQSGLRGSVYVRGGSPQLSALVAGSAIEWLDRPASMPERLTRARVVVHHASMLTTEEALIAGRPQVVAPIYLEHLLTARTLLQHGLAAAILPRTDPRAMVSVLREAVGGGGVGEAARDFAFAYEERFDARAMAAIGEAILCLAHRG